MNNLFTLLYTCHAALTKTRPDFFTFIRTFLSSVSVTNEDACLRIFNSRIGPQYFQFMDDIIGDKRAPEGVSSFHAFEIRYYPTTHVLVFDELCDTDALAIKFDLEKEFKEQSFQKDMFSYLAYKKARRLESWLQEQINGQKGSFTVDLVLLPIHYTKPKGKCPLSACLTHYL